MTDQLSLLARQAVSVLGTDWLQLVGRHANDHATCTITLNMVDGAIPSVEVKQRMSRKREAGSTLTPVARVN